MKKRDALEELAEALRQRQSPSDEAALVTPQGLVYRGVEESVHDRAWNICVWLIANYAIYRGKLVAAERMRREIRDAIGLTNNLRHYAKRADLAHHGAAVGKRSGLGLEQIMWRKCDEHRGKKLIEINETSLATCRAWVAKQDLPPDVVF